MALVIFMTMTTMMFMRKIDNDNGSNYVNYSNDIDNKDDNDDGNSDVNENNDSGSNDDNDDNKGNYDYNVKSVVNQ